MFGKNKKNKKNEQPECDGDCEHCEGGGLDKAARQLAKVLDRADPHNLPDATETMFIEAATYMALSCGQVIMKNGLKTAVGGLTGLLIAAYHLGFEYARSQNVTTFVVKEPDDVSKN